MKIYTKTGDKGQTQVYSKQVLRLHKDDLLLENYGNLDELNAHIGLLGANLKPLDISTQAFIDLVWIQQRLFDIGFAMSDEDKLQAQFIVQLEQWIDDITALLEPQTCFILPGGSVVAAQAHVCRTVTRRAERSLVSLSQQRAINPLALQFLNRLSDYLFVLARFLNKECQESDLEI